MVGIVEFAFDKGIQALGNALSPASPDPGTDTNIPTEAPAPAETLTALPATDFSGNKFDSEPRYVSMYKAFREIGQSDLAAKAFVAEVGRENAFQDKYLFGDHSDPANQKTNAGIFSWQKDRRDALIQDLSAKGLYQNGQISKSYDSMKAMAEFAVKELQSPQYGKGEILNYLNSENADPQQAARMLGRDYIKWRYDDPKYATHHQHRDSWFNKISNYVKGAAPLLEMAKQQAVLQKTQHSDPNFSRQSVESLSLELEGPATESVSMIDKLYLNFQNSYNSTEFNRQNKTNHKMNQAIEKIAKESGVSYDPPSSTWQTIAESFLPFQGDPVTSKLAANEENFNNYLDKIRATNPNYTLPVGSYQDLRLQVGKEVLDIQDQLNTATQDDSTISKLAYGLAAGIPAGLTDPVNLAATVATLPLGGTGVLANAAIQGGVNIGIEGLQIGIEAATDARASYGLPEITGEEVGSRLAMAGAFGAAIGGGAAKIAQVMGKGDAAPTAKPIEPTQLKDIPETNLTPEQSWAVGVKGQVQASPFEDTSLGQLMLDKGIEKAALDLATAKPITVVTENQPGVNVPFKDRVSLDVEKVAYTSSDLRSVRKQVSEGLGQTINELDARPGITKPEYVQSVKATDPATLGRDQALREGSTELDNIYRSEVKAQKELVAEEANPSEAPTKVFKNKQKIQEDDAKFEEALEKANTTEEVLPTSEAVEPVAVPQSVSTEAVAQKEVLAPIKLQLETQSTRLQELRDFHQESLISAEGTQASLTALDDNIAGLTEELGTLSDKSSQRYKVLKEEIAELKESRSVLSKTLTKQNRDIKNTDKSLKKLEEKITRQAEEISSRLDAVVSDSLKAKLSANLDSIEKELTENKLKLDPESKQRFTVEDEDGTIVQLTPEELRTKLREENTAMNFIVDCVLGKG